MSGPAARLHGASVFVGLIAAALVLTACRTIVPSPAPTAAPSAAARSPLPSASSAGTLDAAALVGAITEAGLRSRLDALAEASTASNGFRAVGTRGFCGGRPGRGFASRGRLAGH